MAHTKAKGTSKLGRDSNAQRLGIKKYAGEKVTPGDIIVRQRGTRYHSGENTICAKDDSIVSVANGVVAFKKVKKQAFTGREKSRIFVTVVK